MDAALDARRVAALSDTLIASGLPANAVANRVVLGGTRAEGLRGDDIEAVYRTGGLIDATGYGGRGNVGYGGIGGEVGGLGGICGGFGGLGGLGYGGFR